MHPSDFRRFVELNQSTHRDTSPHGAAWASLVERVASRLEAGETNILREIPGWIAEGFAEFGWQWNGFYVRDDRALHLGHAHGPPVCTPLELHGGLFSSGMCWDAILSEQCLVMHKSRPWPGYVSCDGPSGLQTVAGIACPLRDREGRIVGVWDLDSTAPLDSSEPHCSQVFFSTLCVCVEVSPAALGAT